MLTIIIGRVGSGKSLFALAWLVRELRQTCRQIVTSLAIDLSRLNEWFQNKYPNENVDVIGRITIIEPEQMPQFWRCRGQIGFNRIPIWRGPFGDHSWGWPDDGVCYIIDEGQTAFGARNWQATGPEATNYLTQHRKAGDDVMVISPAAALLDKQFRILAAECIVLDNWYKKKLGLFRAPRRIVYRTFANCPPERTEDSIARGSLTIDAQGLAACYRTEQGMGIVGRLADKGQIAKGIPWYGVFALIALIGTGVWLVGHFARTTAVNAAIGRTVPTQAPQSPPQIPSSSQLPITPSIHPPPPPTNTTEVVGITQVGHTVKIYLSDGRVLTPQAGARIANDGNSIEYHGQIIPRRQAH